MKCPKCNIEMVGSSKRESVGTMQNLHFCPKCKNEILGSVVCGYIEQEEEFFVIIDLLNRPSAEQIRALRSVDVGLSNMSLSELLRKISGCKKLSLGPYWPPYKAEDVKTKLAESGLNVTVE